MTTNKYTARYRPALSNQEILTLVTLLQAIPKPLRSPVQTKLLTKLTVLAVKIDAELATVSYTVSSTLPKLPLEETL